MGIDQSDIKIIIDALTKKYGVSFRVTQEPRVKNYVFISEGNSISFEIETSFMFSKYREDLAVRIENVLAKLNGNVVGHYKLGEFGDISDYK